MAFETLFCLGLLILTATHTTVEKRLDGHILDTDRPRRPEATLQAVNYISQHHIQGICKRHYLTMSAKADRTKAKRALTKEINHTRQLIAECNFDILDNQKETLHVLFQKFTEFHYIFHSDLTDDTEIDDSETYYYSEQDKYIKVLEQLNLALETPHVQVDPKIEKEGGNVSESVTIQPGALPNDLIAFLNLPRVELEHFNGDTLHYHQFIRSFELNIGEICTDSNVKLTRLVQYTTGPAKEAIRGCLLIGGEAGYKRALKILEDRFGNSHLVAERIISDLRKPKSVRSPAEIQQLADDVSNAELILKQLQMLSEVSSQSTILDIVNRLQPYIQIMWKNRALDIKREKSRYPSFSDLVKFIVVRASEVNDPVYGTFSIKREPITKSRMQASSHVTSTTSDRYSTASAPSMSHSKYARPESSCILCKEYHRLWHCKKFKQMSPKERLNLVTQHKLCENCLLSTHNVQSCGKESVCFVPGCGKKHTMYVHVDDQRGPVNQNSSVSNASSSSNRNTYMPIVQVLINNKVKVNALLDTGSSNSFCSSRLINRLNLDGQAVSYCLSTLSKSVHTKTKMVNLSLMSNNGENINLLDVYVIDKIPVKSAYLDRNIYKHFADIDLVTCGDIHEVDLLIGQDHAEALVPLEVRKGNKGEPFAIKTILGWCVNGQSPVRKISHSIVSHFVSCSSAPVENDIYALWKLENEGLDEVGWSREDKSVIELWDRETVKVNGHFEIPIPWKNCQEPLPNNYSLANWRLQSTVKKLEKQGLFQRYDFEISKLVSEGYAEVVPSDQVYSADRIWYLPHHAVVTEKKADKIRVVFDCAAKFKGESLNDKCKQGPDLINKLLHILLRFRQHKYAIQADIEAMYHQVKIPLKDRDALRFLWYDNNQSRVISYRMTSHLFGGIWCSSSSSYALLRTIKENSDTFSDVLTSIEKSFYVDDFLKSLNSQCETIVVLEQSPSLLQKGGFHLTKFIVNDKQLLEKVQECHRAKEVKEICTDASGRALGVKWSIMSDVFSFEVKVKVEQPITRRKMLSVISSMFDPLGLVGPHVLLGKLLFQDATRYRLDWDKEIPIQLSEQWCKWVVSLDSLNHIKVPRCMKPDAFDDGVIELHHFSDASQSAYGSCSYLRCVNKVGQIHTQLVMSRNSVTYQTM